MKNSKSFLLTTVILFTLAIQGFSNLPVPEPIDIEESSFSDFYYYQNKPFRLLLKPDAIFIEVDANMNRASFDNLLSQFPGLSARENSDLKNKKDFIFADRVLDKEELEDIIESLKQKAGVINVSPVFKVPEGKGNPGVLIGVEKEIIAQFKPGVSVNDINSYVNQKGLSIEKEFDLSGGETYLIKVPQEKYSIDCANELYLSGLVNYSEPNFFFTNLLSKDEKKILTDPDDPLFSQQWSHRNTGNNIPGGVVGIPGIDMRTDSAWTITMGDPSVIVSIVDTGIDTLHEDLSERIINGLSIDTYNNLPYASDDFNHGTACAGIVAATGNNNLGVIGVAPQSKIFGVKIFNSEGNTSSAAITNGLIAAWQRGSWISSNSWGGGLPISAADNAIEDGVNLGRNGKGVIWSFATGNDNTSLSWPSTNPNVISVGGVSPCGERKNPASCDNEGWGANYGTGLEIVAPAVKIYSTDRTGIDGYSSGNYVNYFNGTSSATPNVSGVAALILAIDSNLTWNDVRERICLTADKVGDYTYNQPGQLELGGWNNEMGYGKINAYNAVKLTLQLTVPVITHLPLKDTEDITGPFIINARITSVNPMNPESVKLIWGTGDGIFTNTVAMINAGNNIYTAALPGNGLPSVYSYYIYAEDSTSAFSTSPEEAPVNYYTFEAATDTIPPSITHNAFGNIKIIRWPVVISADITDNFDISSAEGEIRVNGGTVNTFPLNLLSGDTYQAQFPNLSVNIGDLIEYRIKAVDNSNQNNIAYSPAFGFYSFNIIDTRALVLLLNDDLSLNERISEDKGGTGDLYSPLGISASLFNNTLEDAGFAVDQINFVSVDTSIFSNYQLIILSAGTKESAIFSSPAVRKAIVNYTLAGGRTLVEGGDVGYVFRKVGPSADLDPVFRREVLNDSTWVSDRSGSDLNITNTTHNLFNDPYNIPSNISVINSEGNSYGARDEVTLQPKSGVIRLANWAGGEAANGGIIINNPNNDTTITRNIFFSFAVSQISELSVAEELIENAAGQLLKDVVVPVELVSFSAVVNDSKILLNWSTASETNNKGFEVYRKKSEDRSRETEWSLLGYVEGNGTTTELKSYSFSDNNLSTGNYIYRLKQIDFDGTYEYSEEINVDVNAPLSFGLEQNYPNPFNPTTVIKYSIPADGIVNLVIYNLLGEKVALLVNEIKKAGKYEAGFDASQLSSGVYFYAIEVKGNDGENFISTKKMCLIK